MGQEIVVFMINLFVEAIYIKCALCRRAQQTKSHEWRKNGKLIFSVSLVLCGCVRYENLHVKPETRIFQHGNSTQNPKMVCY